MLSITGNYVYNPLIPLERPYDFSISDNTWEDDKDDNYISSIPIHKDEIPSPSLPSDDKRSNSAAVQHDKIRQFMQILDDVSNHVHLNDVSNPIDSQDDVSNNFQSKNDLYDIQSKEDIENHQYANKKRKFMESYIHPNDDVHNYFQFKDKLSNHFHFKGKVPNRIYSKDSLHNELQFNLHSPNHFHSEDDVANNFQHKNTKETHRDPFSLVTTSWNRTYTKPYIQYQYDIPYHIQSKDHVPNYVHFKNDIASPFHLTKDRNRNFPFKVDEPKHLLFNGQMSSVFQSKDSVLNSLQSNVDAPNNFQFIYNGPDNIQFKYMPSHFQYKENKNSHRDSQSLHKPDMKRTYLRPESKVAVIPNYMDVDGKHHKWEHLKRSEGNGKYPYYDTNYKRLSYIDILKAWSSIPNKQNKIKPHTMHRRRHVKPISQLNREQNYISENRNEHMIGKLYDGRNWYKSTPWSEIDRMRKIKRSEELRSGKTMIYDDYVGKKAEPLTSKSTDLDHTPSVKDADGDKNPKQLGSPMRDLWNKSKEKLVTEHSSWPKYKTSINGYLTDKAKIAHTRNKTMFMRRKRPYPLQSHKLVSVKNNSEKGMLPKVYQHDINGQQNRRTINRWTDLINNYLATSVRKGAVELEQPVNKDAFEHIEVTTGLEDNDTRQGSKQQKTPVTHTLIRKGTRLLKPKAFSKYFRNSTDRFAFEHKRERETRKKHPG